MLGQITLHIGSNTHQHDIYTWTWDEAAGITRSLLARIAAQHPTSVCRAELRSLAPGRDRCVTFGLADYMASVSSK
jgi:hypothetical protein